jgi:hypothetical protein
MKKDLLERKRIQELADELIVQYQEMKDERSQIHSWEWENDFYFTILGLMELYHTYVGGYASQITTKGTVINPTGALKVLSESRLFDEAYFAQWYFSPHNQHLKVKKYANLLDYLRILVMDYISHHPALTPPSPPGPLGHLWERGSFF